MDELISVVMGLYNEKPEEANIAIDSILKQTHKNLELIIVLDNPTNLELKNLLIEVSKKDSRIIPIINSQNIGLAISMNNAIEHSSGEYIARMDADDISMPNRLKVEIKKLLDTNADVITSNASYINEVGEVIGQHNTIPEHDGDFAKLLPIGNNIVHPSILMKKSTFNKAGGYRDVYVEDYDLWLRMLTMDAKVLGINENLIQYRVRTDSMTQSKPVYGYLATEYVKDLYKQRLQNGSDNFNEKDFSEYFKKNGYSKVKEEKLFKIMNTPSKSVIKNLKLLLNFYGRNLLMNTFRFKMKLRKLTR